MEASAGLLMSCWCLTQVNIGRLKGHGASLATSVFWPWFAELYCACRCSATFAVQPVEEYNAGVLEDPGLDALAVTQEPQLVSSKSKMQVCQRNMSNELFLTHKWADVNAQCAFGVRLECVVYDMCLCSMQIELSSPDPADEEAVAYYNAQRGMHSKTNTLRRGMAATRRKPAVAKF